MAVNLIPFIYTAVFAAILVVAVPRREIRRLAIYGIIFGGLFDVLLVSIASFMGAFRYINYEPFGLFGIHFMAPIAWTIFFMIYFYFLPKKKVYLYIYTTMGMFYSMLFCQMLTKIGILSLAHGIVDSIVPFIPWFIIATWGYLKLSGTDYSFESVTITQNKQRESFRPLYNPVAKPLPERKEDDKDGV